METVVLKIDEEQLSRVVGTAVRQAIADQQASVLGKQAAAKYLGISSVTLWRLEGQKILKPILIGDREVYTRKELDAFLDAARAKAEAA